MYRIVCRVCFSMNKQQLRQRMREVRRNIDDRAQKDARICREIENLPEYQQAKCVLFYMATGSEADLSDAMEAALRQGKRVCLPVCRSEGRMDAVEYTGRDCLRSGTFGIMEPQGSIVMPECIDLVLCPGLAFDPFGGRLGYGKGYYDRYLRKVHAFWAGICYTECIVEKVPVEETDVPVKALVSPAGVMRMGGLT